MTNQVLNKTWQYMACDFQLRGDQYPRVKSFACVSNKGQSHMCTFNVPYLHDAIRFQQHNTYTQAFKVTIKQLHLDSVP